MNIKNWIPYSKEKKTNGNPKSIFVKFARCSCLIELSTVGGAINASQNTITTASEWVGAWESLTQDAFGYTASSTRFGMSEWHGSYWDLLICSLYSFCFLPWRSHC